MFPQRLPRTLEKGRGVIKTIPLKLFRGFMSFQFYSIQRQNKGSSDFFSWTQRLNEYREKWPTWKAWFLIIATLCEHIISMTTSHFDTRVFPKVDHSANVARIVLVEHTFGSVVDLNFW